MSDYDLPDFGADLLNSCNTSCRHLLESMVIGNEQIYET